MRCREILDAWTFDKALLLVVQTDRCCFTNFLIGHAAGEIIDIEASPITAPTFIPSASQFERIAPHSLYRANRLERLL
jgi:isopenicillin-N N-acyltransferase-like protein